MSQNVYSKLKKKYKIRSEDDDFRLRTLAKYKKVIKLPADIGRYYMIDHKKEQPSNHRLVTLEGIF